MGFELGIFGETTYRFEKEGVSQRKSIEKGCWTEEPVIEQWIWRYPPSGGIYPFEYSTDVGRKWTCTWIPATPPKP
jgi:hypothetical protein